MSDCIFCKIIAKEIPSKFVYENEDVVAFRDINQKAPVHILVVPKDHIESLREVRQNHKRLMGSLMFAVAEVARQFGIDKKGYKIVINNGEDAGQLVFHLHVHLLGGWRGPEKWKV